MLQGLLFLPSEPFKTLHLLLRSSNHQILPLANHHVRRTSRNNTEHRLDAYLEAHLDVPNPSVPNGLTLGLLVPGLGAYCVDPILVSHGQSVYRRLGEVLVSLRCTLPEWL